MSNHQRALLLINRKARRGGENLDSAINWLEGHNFSILKRVIEVNDHIPDLIKRLGHEVDIVIIGGGDGTLHHSLEALLEIDKPLGVLPLGTANDLARTLAIPSDEHKACEVIAAGHQRLIDLGCVNGKHFLNVASIGLGVGVTEHLTGDIKQRWGALSYGISLIRAYRAIRPQRFTVICEDHTETFWSIQISIGNGRFYGGGMIVHNEATVDDGYLDLYSIEPKSIWRLIVVLPFISAGRYELLRGVQHRRGQYISISTEKPMRITMDGELNSSTPAHFFVKPKALSVLTPRPIES